jgi:hypothetical protein
MKVIDVRGTVVFLDGVFYLKCGSFESALTLPQFADIARKAMVEEAQTKRCPHRNTYGAPCIKLPGHKSKHQYLKKQFKKKVEVPAEVVSAEPHVDPRTERSAKGLCSFCDHKPTKGKKLCAKHLRTARKNASLAQKARARNLRAAKAAA